MKLREWLEFKFSRSQRKGLLSQAFQEVKIGNARYAVVMVKLARDVDFQDSDPRLSGGRGRMALGFGLTPATPEFLAICKRPISMRIPLTLSDEIINQYVAFRD